MNFGSLLKTTLKVALALIPVVIEILDNGKA